MKIIKIEDNDYPDNLKLIDNPPKTLYLEGNIELLNTNIISIVGTRKCSEYGKDLTKKFVKELVKQNITIASGLAKGIDTAAHIATLENKGKTIAVLGNGLNKIFPKENIKLYHEIIKKDGLVISEYSPDEKADSKKFLERNRIISGISLGILVIEAKYRSGTSVTAKIAQKQRKKVFAIPHELNNINGIGTNRLIKQNIAKLVTNAKDIIENIEELKSLKKTSPNITKSKRILTKKNITNLKINIKYRKKINIPEGIKNNEYEKIYKLILNNPNNLNEIYAKSTKNILETNQILLMLEIEGYIKKTVGGYICTEKKK